MLVERRNSLSLVLVYILLAVQISRFILTVKLLAHSYPTIRVTYRKNSFLFLNIFILLKFPVRKKRIKKVKTV